MSEMNIRSPWPGWQIVRTLGSGSFGAVYEIQRLLLDGSMEKAAMKVISLPKDSSEAKALLKSYDLKSINKRYLEDLTDIVKEYGLMSQLKGNVNIVHCEDLHHELRADGIGYNLFIKMELLTPADQLFGRDVQETQVIRLGMDICNALVACRRNNIIHRDIKPANIMVSADGTYKLGDFGIAKNCDRTSDGTFAGTLNYMAPEVYRNRPYGASVDIYSLGMVLYMLLNENVGPFLPYPPALPRASEAENARQRRFNGEALPAPKHGSDALKRIVLKACAYQPADRYASAEEMLAALRALSGGSAYGNSHGNEPRDTSREQKLAKLRKAVLEAEENVRKSGDMDSKIDLAFSRQEYQRALQGFGAQDFITSTLIDRNEAARGCTRTIFAYGKNVTVTVPAGTKNNTRLKYEGILGQSDEGGSIPLYLYVDYKDAPEGFFARGKGIRPIVVSKDTALRPFDHETYDSASMQEAQVGFTRDSVHNGAGELVTIAVPGGLNLNDNVKLCFPGYANGGRGDLYVRISVRYGPAYGGTQSQTNPTYGGTQSQTNPTYGGTQSQTNPTYGGTQSRTNPTYGGGNGSGGSTYGNSWDNETQGTTGTQGSAAGHRNVAQGVGMGANVPPRQPAQAAAGANAGSSREEKLAEMRRLLREDEEWARKTGLPGSIRRAAWRRLAIRNLENGIDEFDVQTATLLGCKEVPRGCTREIWVGDRMVKVNVPAGTKNNTILKFSGLGRIDPVTRKAGTLFLFVAYNDAPEGFRKQGIRPKGMNWGSSSNFDYWDTITISEDEKMHGFSREVFNGEEFLTIAMDQIDCAGAKESFFKGYGMKNPATGECGNLTVGLNVVRADKNPVQEARVDNLFMEERAAWQRRENQNRVNGVGEYDFQTTTLIDRKEAAQGCTREIYVGDRMVKVNVPAGTKNNTVLKYTGLGKKDPATGKCGTLHLFVVHKDVPGEFKNKGKGIDPVYVPAHKKGKSAWDYYTTVCVSKQERRAGFTREVFNGDDFVTIAVPRSLYGNEKAKYVGYGRKNPLTNECGDLYVSIVVMG